VLCLELALIGLRSQDLRGHNRNPRLASPGSTTEVETVHPHVQLFGRQAAHRLRPYSHEHRAANGDSRIRPANMLLPGRERQRMAGRTQIRTAQGERRKGAGQHEMDSGGTEARLGFLLGDAASWEADDPRGRWRWPDRAHGGRPAGSEPVRKSGSPPR
jgi:hypothetical protein